MGDYSLLRHFGARLDGLSSAILVFPLFLVYQVGILSGQGQNGVDVVTRSLVEMSRRDLDNYLFILVSMVLGYAAVVVLLRSRGSFHPRQFLPTLLESAFYALIMGSLIVFVMSEFLGVSPGLALGRRSTMDVLVISAGAGFHEELMFRVILMGGLAWLFTGLTGPRRAWMAALVLSSLAFSLAHHIGPMGEPFSYNAFVYRTLAGAFFALVYQLRGFAVAAWSHALYDVYVLSLGT